MKRALLIALCATFIVAFGAGQVLADAYNVTANFGVRVTEQGSSERVGSISFAPDDTAIDAFAAGQIITVELLGGATISRTFGANYNFNGGDDVATFDPTTDPAGWPGAGDYRAWAVEGDDFVTIEILNASALGSNDTVVIGQDEPDGTADSALCYNLVGTIYNSTDPARQLVQNSYRDNLSSTFSGDIFVATVKAKSIVFDLCGKALPTDILDPEGLGQGEDCGFGSGSACIFTFEDTGAGALTGDYDFIIGKTDGAKVGVGFNNVQVEKFDSISMTWNPVFTALDERRDNEGEEITISDFDSDEELWVATTEIEVDVTLTGPGLYRVIAIYEFDTCVAGPGIWTIDVFASLDPCGGSFSEVDWDAVEFFLPSGIPTASDLPYAAAAAGGWFNGLVLTNPGSIAVEISATIYEEDGDMYTGSATVAARSQAVGLVASVLSPTTTGSDAAFGDEAYAIYFTAEGQFYSFLFIGDGTQAQGYVGVNPFLQFGLESAYMSP